MQMTEVIFLVEEAPEGGCEAHVLGCAINTQAQTFMDLEEVLRDAVRCHFDEADRPQVIRIHLVRDDVISA